MQWELIDVGGYNCLCGRLVCGKKKAERREG